MWVSHFRLEVFLPYSTSYCMCVSFSTFFIFLTIFQVLKCTFLIFHVFPCLSLYTSSYYVIFLIFLVGQFSHHIPGSTVCISNLSHFQCFLPYSSSYSVCVSFSMFFSILTIMQVLECVFLICQVFQFSHHVPAHTVCISHLWSFPCFSPYWNMSYNVCF